MFKCPFPGEKDIHCDGDIAPKNDEEEEYYLLESVQLAQVVGVETSFGHCAGYQEQTIDVVDTASWR